MALIATDPSLQISEQIAQYFNFLIVNQREIAIPPTLPQLISPPIITRRGMSASVLASTIIANMPGIGITTDPLEEGTTNVMVAYTQLISAAIIQHIQTCGSVRIGIDVGQSIEGTGVSPSGPIDVEGVTNSPIEAFGVLQ